MTSLAVVLDTSAIVALADTDDRDHAATSKALSQDRGPYVVPAGILSEAAYMLEARAGESALDAFLEDLATRRYLLDCGEDDFLRIGELTTRFRSLPLGFADASVAACAERREGRILSVDRRDFDVLAGEIRLEIVP